MIDEPAAGRTRLRLFVTGGTSRAARAVVRIRDLCDRHLGGSYDLDVVDVLDRPDMAEKYKILATPTLIREHPAPQRRIVGDHSDDGALRVALELFEEARAAAGSRVGG